MDPVSTVSSSRTALNPNAREFIPTTIRLNSPATNANVGDEHEPLTASENGKTFSDKAGSSDTCTLDEESRRYWDVQLPDDILAPEDDFFMPAAEDEVSALRASAAEPASASAGLKDPIDLLENLPWKRQVFNTKQLQGVASIIAHDFPYTDCSVQSPSRNLWEDELALPSSELSSMGGSWNEHPVIATSNLIALSQNTLKERSNADGLSLLANDIPSLPVQSLANFYHENGGELDPALRTHTQLKLQDDGNSQPNLPAPSQFSPNSRSLYSSALSPPDLLGGLQHFVGEVDMQQPIGNSCCVSSSLMSMGPYASSRYGNFPYFNDERFDPVQLHQKHGLSPQGWIEPDDASVNLILELREEARNHARIHNFYIEQATYTGNRIHAKEATAKGQFHNRLMKIAQTKASEMEIQRNMFAMPEPSVGPGQTQLVDLRGFHVNEALNILRRELSTFRMAAWCLRQRQQVFISMGMGHGRGARTPGRLLFAVKRYLLEEELLSFTEPQPGVVKVVVG